MRNPCLLCILLTQVLTAYCQHDTAWRYLDAGLHFTTRKKAVLQVFVVRNGPHWVLTSREHDTLPHLRVSFKDENLTIKDGVYSISYKGGIPKQKGYYVNDTADGVWQSWYANGQQQDSGRLTANSFTGIWKHWYENGQLKNIEGYSIYPRPARIHLRLQLKDAQVSVLPDLDIAGVFDGLWQSWYEDGTMEYSGAWKNDSLTGVWKWFRKDGTPSSVETYANGKLVSLECYDEKGAYSGLSCSISKKPALIHPFFDAHDYIIDQLLQRKKIQQSIDEWAMTITLDFIVTKTGGISNMSIKNVPGSGFEKALLEIIAKMPAWSPAVSHNRAIDYPVHVALLCTPRGW